MKKSHLNFKNLSGEEIRPYLRPLGELRIQVFRDFPYLYEGDLAYERGYLQTYVNCEKSLAVLVFDGETLVGASTGLPMSDETPEFFTPLKAAGLDIEKTFYFGESVLLAPYRGLGVGHEFFKRREDHAQKVIPKLKHTCFCAVERPDNHPLKPEDYKPLDEFWKKWGHQKSEGLQVSFPWKDIDKEKEDHKKLTFWIKDWPTSGE